MKTYPAKSVKNQASLSIAVFILAAVGLSLLLLAPTASASKQAIAYFGSESGTGPRGGDFIFPADIAVNSSGAGLANKGDIYVTDSKFEEGNRIQRFAQDDNGTPANPYDDTYEFISAWGTDVDSTPSGGSDYEICSVAADCQYGAGSGGNGTGAGNGSLSAPGGIAVDQDSGDVYVADWRNSRVSAYAGDGAFLRSFGYDVVESGPDNAGTGYEVCVAANGDVCKAGLFGSAAGQIGGSGVVPGGQNISVSQPDGNPATGTVFLSDVGNHRIDTYNLDGSSPSNFGSAADFGASGPGHVAVDSRGIVYAEEDGGSPATHRIDRYDSQDANGVGVGFLAPIAIPPLLTEGGNQVNSGLEVDPDSDGAGPDTDVLYALRGLITGSVVQQFGPLNAPGGSAPPNAVDDTHGALAAFQGTWGLGLDDSSGRLFVASPYAVNNEAPKSGVYVLDPAGGAPSASLDSISDLTPTSAKVHATVEPNGAPDVTYRLEYSLDGSKWTQLPKVVVGSQESPQQVEALLSPGIGLEAKTLYHVRLSVAKPFAPAVTTSELTFTTLAAAPLAETTGSPVRTTTTAQLGGRVTPFSSATTYHFEYGDQGPCEANPCTSTAPQPAGSGAATEWVSEELEGLQPNTTYYYRLVADNGAPSSPSSGGDMTITTRASEAPLSHGHFPGPPGSDRAYEQVSPADSSGNPVGSALGFSDNGERALYQISGGTPISEAGSAFSFYFSQRSAGGWEVRNISPPRDELIGPSWSTSPVRGDLSSLTAVNVSETSDDSTVWRLHPDAAPEKLVSVKSTDLPFVHTSEGSPRIIATLTRLKAGGDPAYPGAAPSSNDYDITSGSPHLVSFLPGETVAPCGRFVGPVAMSWSALSSDGSLLFFSSVGPTCGAISECTGSSCGASSKIYVRDLEAGATSTVSPPPLSGADCGSGVPERITAHALYFWTKNRLAPEDTAPSSCSDRSGGDVYRYDLGDASLKCVTCVLPGFPTDVLTNPNDPGERIAVASDDSRLYFLSNSPQPLVPGAVPDSVVGTTYRLDLETGSLRWLGQGIDVGSSPALKTADGSVAFFRSSNPDLNPLGTGSDNGGTEQTYRYDDRDGSLTCISCPQDGSPASGATPNTAGGVAVASKDGKDVGFSTPTPLVPADQNTPGAGHDPRAGMDVYEWRDGRLFLITDGLTNWPHLGEPKAQSVSDSGRDLFFTAAAQYTPDALDGYNRLYDARIGGGFEFPSPPNPCPLEVCQGTPKGAPEEASPGTGSFAGPGNAHQRAHNKKKKKHKKQHLHKTQSRHQAKQNRGTAR